MNFLDKIIQQKKEQLFLLKKKQPHFDLSHPIQKRDFINALQQKSTAIIAEIKKASPTRGLICKKFNPTQIAKDYEHAGAACLSVLTETAFFMGKNDDLIEAKKAASLPVLRKDFIIDDYQIHESKAIGADCILLIAACLDDKQLHDYYQTAQALQLTCLVEVHDEKELERTLLLDNKLIGINNRNLKTLQIDLTTTIRLAKNIPKDSIIVCESGINDKNDIATMKKNHIHVFLIGSALMEKSSPGDELNKLLI